MGNSEPKVSILILNWNGRALLEECLKSIEDHTQYNNYEVVVIDNNSDDGSVQFVIDQFPEATIIRNASNLGFAEANNRGIRCSTSEYVLLLNNDVEVKDGWLTALVEAAETRPEVGIVSPRIVYGDGQPQFFGDKVVLTESNVPNAVLDFIRKLETRSDHEKEIISGIGAALLISRDVFDAVGYLDEEYEFYNEDTDFCLRARGNGFKIWYTPEAEVIHKSRSTSSSDSYYSYYLRRKSRVRFYVLNYSLPRLAAQFPVECLTVVDSVRNGYTGWLFRAYLDACKRLPTDLKQRRERSQVHHTTNKFRRLYEYLRGDSRS
jgi:GT2 family glycosyltransferase